MDINITFFELRFSEEEALYVPGNYCDTLCKTDSTTDTSPYYCWTVQIQLSVSHMKSLKASQMLVSTLIGSSKHRKAFISQLTAESSKSVLSMSSSDSTCWTAFSSWLNWQVVSFCSPVSSLPAGGTHKKHLQLWCVKLYKDLCHTNHKKCHKNVISCIRRKRSSCSGWPVLVSPSFFSVRKIRCIISFFVVWHVYFSSGSLPSFPADKCKIWQLAKQRNNPSCITETQP